MRRLVPVLAAITALTWVMVPGEAGARPDMIATITNDVETEFGVYHPIPVQFTPAVPTFPIAPDFSNVCNLNDVNRTFTARDSMLLLANHFTVKWSSIDFETCGSESHGRAMQMHYIYNDCTHHNIPVFVTGDAVLHIYHTLFDAFLADIEAQRFIAKVIVLTQTLIAEHQALYDRGVGQTLLSARKPTNAVLTVHLPVHCPGRNEG